MNLNEFPSKDAKNVEILKFYSIIEAAYFHKNAYYNKKKS